MSIDIRITQKGLRKKTLPLEVITGGTLVYGSGDGTKFEEGNLEGKKFCSIIRSMSPEDSVLPGLPKRKLLWICGR